MSYIDRANAKNIISDSSKELFEQLVIVRFIVFLFKINNCYFCINIYFFKKLLLWL